MNVAKASRRLKSDHRAEGRLRGAIVEALEDRQMLSLTIDVRVHGGGKSTTASTVGQVINLDVFAVIQGNSMDLTQDGIQDVAAAFISTNTGFGPIAGDLAAQNIAPFNGTGAQVGISQDVNADGNKDVSGTDPNSLTGYFFARSDSFETGATSFQIGTLTYTVTNLNFGGETDVNYAKVVTNAPNVIWREDGNAETNVGGTLLAGAPVTITDAAAHPVGPVAVNDAFNAFSGVPDPVTVLSNDGDYTGTLDPTSVVITVVPNHGGAASVNHTTGVITYTPAVGFVGTETLSYTVGDSNSATSAPAVVTFTVAPPITAVADTSTAVTAVGDSINVLANDTDVNGTVNPATVTITTAPNQGGTAVPNPTTGVVVYTSAAGFVGTETFSYTVKDNNNVTSAPATVTVTVQPPPVAVADAFSAATGTLVTVHELVNDTDPAGTGTIDPTTVVITVPPNHGGTATADPTTGDISYTSAPGFTGTETLSYTVRDSRGAVTNPATVTFTVQQSIPVGVPDSATAYSGIAQNIPVLSNDTDNVGTLVPSTVVITSVPNQGGTATPNTTSGQISYTSIAGFTGTETFSYTVKDNTGATTNPTVVTVTVLPAVPVAIPDSATALLNTAVTIPVLQNDTSPIGLMPSTVAVATQPTSGTTVVNPTDGSITYTPKSGFVGSDSFTYTVADSASHVSTATTVSIVVDVELSTVKGGNRSIVYTDGDGTVVTTTLNKGVADFAFSGTATAAVSHGKVTVTGTTVALSGITLAGTTAASALTIRGKGGDGIATVGTITDPAPLGRIVAPNVSLTGAVNLASLTALQIANASSATIIIAGAGNLSVKSGTLSSTTITASASNLTLVSASMTGTTISAAKGQSVRIAGDSATSTMTFASSAATINILGNLTGGTLTFGAPAKGTISLNRLAVSGAISTTTIGATNDIQTLQAASLSGDTIGAGPGAPGVAFAAATAANTGTSKINSIRLTAKADSFAGSTIIAHTINTALLGLVVTDNSGTPEGLAAAAVNLVTGSANGTPFKLTKKAFTAFASGDLVIKPLT